MSSRPRPAAAPRAGADVRDGVPAGLEDLVGLVPSSVLASQWVRRLAGVSFLGALDLAPGCRRGTSRLEHCAGVARLAAGIGRTLRLAPETLRLLVTAAFLHDVGHWPFSHSAEAGFQAVLGADHHELTRWILQGGGPLAREASLAPLLEAGGIEPARAWAMVAGDAAALGGDAALVPLVSGVLSVDTLDGITRAARAFGLRGVRIPRRPFELRESRLWARREEIPALDRFWQLKDRVYKDVVNRPECAALELRFGSIAAGAVDPSILGDDGATLAALDDDAFLARLGAGRARLAPHPSDAAARYEAAADPGTAPVRILRRYEVDESVRPGPGGLAAEAWSRRWTNRRQRWFLVGGDPALQLDLPHLRETEAATL